MPLEAEKKLNSTVLVVLVATAVILQALTNILFKSAALSLESFELMNIITNIFYILSMVCFFLRIVVWQIALKFMELSYLYFFKSLGYPILLGVSYYFFNEKVDFWNILGTVIICVGIVYLSMGKLKTE